MSKEAREILRILKSELGVKDLIAATIKNVNKTNATCNVIDSDDLEIGGVRLQSIVDDNVKGCKFFPKVGSVVLVDKLSNTGEMFIVMMSEVEEVNFSIGETSFKITNDGININDGTLGGLLKLGATVERFNKIENDLNNLKTVFSSWKPVSSDGGAALKAVSGVWASSKLTPTKNRDVENDKVKQ